MKCSNCGAELEQDAVFCINCGQRVEESISDNTVTSEIPNEAVEDSKKGGKKKSKKTLIIIIIVIVALILLLVIGAIVLAALGVGIFAISNSASGNVGGQELYYVTEDGEVCYYDMGKKESVEIFKDKDNYYAISFRNTNGNNVEESFSKLEKLNPEWDMFEFSVYAKANMKYMVFSHDKNKFSYMDYDKMKVYKKDTKKDDKEKLFDASSASFGTDSVLIMDDERNMTWASLSGDDSIEYPDDAVGYSFGKDFENYAFIDEDEKAYVVTDGNKEKIDNNVINVYLPDDYPSSPILYVKYEDDYCVNSVWKYDKNGTKECLVEEDPDEDYSYSAIIGYDEGAYIFTEYWDTYSIYYFNGKQITEVVSEVEDFSIYTGSFDKAILTIYADGDYYILNGANNRRIEAEDVYRMKFSADCSKLAIISEDGNSYRLDVYNVNNDLTLKKLYESDDVYKDSIWFTEDNRLIYVNDYSNGEGALYVDKNKIDDDVDVAQIRYASGNNGGIAYIKENSSTGGELYVYNGRKSEKISDDVYMFDILDDGQVVFLRDFSLSSYKGDLVIYKNGKEEVIEEGVSGFFVQDIYELEF